MASRDFLHVRTAAFISLLLSLAAEAPALGQADLRVGSVGEFPVLEVGAADGPDSEMFVWAHDAALLPGGGIVVLDAGAVELRFFDATGELIAVGGRDGGGPGEFRAPFGVEVAADTVLAWDYVRRVISRWSTDGEFLGERSVRHHPTAHQGALLSDGSVIVPLYTESEQPQSGWYRPQATLLRYIGDEEPLDLGRFPWDELSVEDPTSSTIPFRSTSKAAAGGSPLHVYVGDDTNDAVVRWYDGAGEFVGTLELLDESEEISPQVWESILKALPVEGLPEEALVRIRSRWPRPERTSVFEDLLADPAGRLWAVSRSPKGDLRASVYEQGLPTHTITLPEAHRVLEVGHDRLVVLALGPLDVEIVRVFSFELP